MPDTLISTEALTYRRPAAAKNGQSVGELWNAHRKAWNAYSKAMDKDDAAALEAAEKRYSDVEKAFIAAPVQSAADAALKIRFALDALSAEERDGDPVTRALYGALSGLKRLN